MRKASIIGGILFVLILWTSVSFDFVDQIAIIMVSVWGVMGFSFVFNICYDVHKLGNTKEETQ